MTDDFSYIFTAKVLAQTGHLAFNGWGAPMVGWQLLPAALLIKIFGFSFSVARFCTLVIAMMTAFLFQRSLNRSGLSVWNATIGTLTLVLSPMYLVLSFSFLTDMWCLFALVLCFYACLRALQSTSADGAIAWLWFAAISNAIFGTTRQLAFLGVIVMVPCATWLLRKRKSVLLWGMLACIVGDCLVLYALHWFSKQPYTVSIPIQPHKRLIVGQEADIFLRPLLELPMLMLPVLLMFLPSFKYARSKARIVFVAACLGVMGLAVWLHQAGRLSRWLAPFVVRNGSVLGQYGFFTTWPTSRFLNPQWPPLGMPEALRLVLAVASIAGLVSLLLSYTRKRGAQRPRPEISPALSARELTVLVLPFVFLYVAALIPTGLANATLDRYLLPLVAFALLLVVRHYQDTVQYRLPLAALSLALLSGILSILPLHDLFSLYRATLQAANEMRAAGVPRSSIDAGFEYNGWTQIDEGRFIVFEGVRVPPGTRLDRQIQDNICPIIIPNWIPAVKPEYSLSFDPSACGGLSRFRPVQWHRWLLPHNVPMYIVNNPIVPGYTDCWLRHVQQDPATRDVLMDGCQSLISKSQH